MVRFHRWKFHSLEFAAEASLTAERQEPLDRESVIRLASVLSLAEDNAFVVGGQALNLWAERYAPTVPTLADFGPFTSKDLDYFGLRKAAEKLAATLEGKVLYPDQEDSGPNSAVVSVNLNGVEMEIDFLWNVIGVEPKSLSKYAAELLVPVKEGHAFIAIPVMHPLHCMQSRVANVTQLGRSDEVALRQLAAAPYVLEAYIDEVLEMGELKEAKLVLRDLFHYLLRDIQGKKIPTLDMRDPLEIIRSLRTDKRLDWRYRWFNVRSMIVKLRAKRLA